jgi:hypothetical protein
MEAMKQPEVP